MARESKSLFAPVSRVVVVVVKGQRSCWRAGWLPTAAPGPPSAPKTNGSRYSFSAALTETAATVHFVTTRGAGGDGQMHTIKVTGHNYSTMTEKTTL